MLTAGEFCSKNAVMGSYLQLILDITFNLQRYAAIALTSEYTCRVQAQILSHLLMYCLRAEIRQDEIMLLDMFVWLPAISAPGISEMDLLQQFILKV
jgi:hypothetical protein